MTEVRGDFTSTEAITQKVEVLARTTSVDSHPFCVGADFFKAHFSSEAERASAMRLRTVSRLNTGMQPPTSTIGAYHVR